MNKYGSTSGLTKQPGSKVVKKLDFSMEGTLILEGDASFASQSPNIGDAYPGNGQLTCHNVETEYLKLGRIRVTASYVGVMVDPTPWFLEGNGALDKESILTHPQFQDSLGGSASSPLNGALYDASTGDFIGFPATATGGLAGVDSWYTPHIVYRFTRWSYSQPYFDKIGTIVSPPLPVAMPPNVTNFLQGPLTYRQVGSLYQITNEVWASGPNGWNQLIYGGNY
jgi:hypothetical protein